MKNKALGQSSQPPTETIPDIPDPVVATSEEPVAKKPKFRNYQPFDKKLANDETTSSIVEKSNEENIKKKIKSVEDSDDAHPVVKKTLLEEELEKAQNEEINLVPKKVNADLKQQIVGKLEKLKRRTQKAIVEILREKLSMEAIDE